MMFFLMAKISATDALAISLLIVMAFTFGALFSLFLVMARNGKRAEEEPDVFEGLIAEKKEESELQSWADQAQEQVKGEKSPSLEAWEKDGDWWKKG